MTQVNRIIGRSPGSRVAAAVAVVFATTLGGCVTDSVESTTGRPLPPDPREVPPASSGDPINAISVLKSPQPIDTTGNGFPNLLGAGVYLFARPYPIPRFAVGTLVFDLFEPGGFDVMQGASSPPLATWTLGPEDMAAAQVDNLIGPGYQISLDLGAIGLSELAVDSADLVVRFLPSDGSEPVVSSVQRVPFRLF
ncbi:MAG: hypothetical protein GY895_12135 [Phycisphaera sp.]|nr:hypothetical protein [Phycisphaera sp.]